jgi:hypothetical protein
MGANVEAIYRFRLEGVIMKASRANAYRTETGVISSIMLKLGSDVVKEEVDRYYDFVCRYYSMPAKRRRNSFPTRSNE